MEEITFEYLEDFINDDSFRQFVAGENKESVEKWKKWIADHPSALTEFETAIKVTKLLVKTKKVSYDLHTEEELSLLLSRIRQKKNKKNQDSSFTRFQWSRIAAMIVLLLSLAGILYFIIGNKNNEAIAYNEIIVPLGEKSQLVLADGTHIWINSSSKLKYPVDFSKKNRTVYLEGEAFFDVTHNEKLPFEVNTPNMKIKVLGTSFNIKNYPGDKNAVTTVVRGLVRVETTDAKTRSVLLKQNENIVVFTGSLKNSVPTKELQNRADNKEMPVSLDPVINKKVNVEEITSWKDQMLVFNYESLEDVVLKMERWYNVRIYIMDEELKKERYRGKFVNNETIYQVLEALKYTTPINYKIKNNEFFIEKPK